MHWRPVQTISRQYRVDRREIGFLRFIFEGYDGIAILTTEDAQAGRISLIIAPGCEAEVDAVLADLARDILMEPVDAIGH